MSTELKKDVPNDPIILPPRKRGKLSFSSIDPEEMGQDLTKSVVNYATEIKAGKSIQRIGFEEDPTRPNKLQGLWVPKNNLVPDNVIKRIIVRDDLVAAIVNARASMISAFGRELQDRFATGFRIEPRRGIMEDATDEQKEKLQKRIEIASKKLSTCGTDEGWDADDRMSLATFFHQQARNAVSFGRFATEFVWVQEVSGEKTFHSFRPIDVGTIYRVTPHNDAAASVRKRALSVLERLKNEKLNPEKFVNDEYSWIQVINNIAKQAFTAEELVVHNVYPVTDIEFGGYPVSPIDTAYDAITTHMNIGTHNKLYFQSGRAARGMIVIKSSDVDQSIIHGVRQQFNAAINSVGNSWRVPVFGIDVDDNIQWQPLEMQGGRDMEFQYLSDSNARTILSAFQMSPEELPGYQHLTRGTNNQSLSESSNEYKLEAGRDIGIRPLMAQFQDFLNDRVLGLIDPTVAKLCTLKLYGLDADTAEKESTRLQQDQALHLTYDEILERVEKDPVGEEWAGRFPLNPAWQALVDKYFYVGEIQEKFFGKKDASKDPALKYMRDPFYFQQQQLLMQQQQMQQQAQAQQQQPQPQPQQPKQDEQGLSQDVKQLHAQGATYKQIAAQLGISEDEVRNSVSRSGGSSSGGAEQGSGDLSEGVDQLLNMLSKGEEKLPTNKRRLLAQHKAIVKTTMDAWEKESEQVLAEIVKSVQRHVPAPKKKA